MYLNFLKIVYLSVYHLSRLLLLYHDPQLCNHIDSLKLSFADFRYTYKFFRNFPTPQFSLADASVADPDKRTGSRSNPALDLLDL